MSLELAAQVPERGFEAALTVPRGSTLALLGPNGAGKSTLLAVAAGLLVPHEGRVSLHGRVLTEVAAGRRTTWVAPHERRVGLLAQDPLLFPHLTALDNVAFGPRSRGAGRGQARRVAAAWLDRVELGHLADRRPRQLSGGQAQRVALARALAGDPEMVLLDEPLAALDVDVAPALRHTLDQVLDGRTTVMATHDVLDAALLADHVAVIDGGRVVEQGPTQTVLARPRSAFGARIAGLNLVAGTWDGEGVRTPEGRRVVGRVHEGPLPSGAAVVAIFRPASVAVQVVVAPGSPRNVVEVTVATLAPHGDLVRVSGDGLHADVTPAAVADLGLAPGRRAHFVVKAAEVEVYASSH